MMVPWYHGITKIKNKRCLRLANGELGNVTMVYSIVFLWGKIVTIKDGCRGMQEGRDTLRYRFYCVKA